jgi:hypothetical protein
MTKNRLIIEINTEITQEVLEYIFDCWVTFVVGDLGLKPNELPMYADMTRTQMPTTA